MKGQFRMMLLSAGTNLRYKVMKKSRLISVFIAAVMIISVLPLSVFADGNKLTVSLSSSISGKTDLSVGDIFTVKAKIGDVNDGFANGGFCFTFSDNLSVESAELFGVEYDAVVGGGSAKLIYSDVMDCNATGEELCSMTFKINSAGSIEVGFSGKDVKNILLDTVDVSVSPAKITASASSQSNPKPTVKTKKLPEGKLGTEYSAVIEADVEDAVFDVSSGELPDGLVLGGDGSLFGTPSKVGEFKFSVTASKNGQESDPVSYTVKIVSGQSLAVPSGLEWSGDTTAKWSAVAGAVDYSVQLFKNKKEAGDAIKTGGKTEIDLSSKMKSGGSYTFTVMALADKETGIYSDSVYSSQSDAKNVTGTLSTPKIKLIENYADGGLKYQITDGNEQGSVSSYYIEIYKSGSATPAKTLTVSSKAGNISCDGTIKGGTSYMANVKAVSADSKVTQDSGVSVLSEAVKAAHKITAITVVNAPKSDYAEGEVLDLSGTSVRVTYEDGSEELINYSRFESVGIKTSIANGTSLKLSNNGAKIKLTSSSGVSVNVVTVSVKSNGCKHAATNEVRHEPTCNENGSIEQVCISCGLTVSSTPLPATGEHIYGNWTVVTEATATADGLRVRKCTVCGTEDRDILTWGEPEDTSSSDTSDGDETKQNNEDDGSTSDVSKTFLIAVIVVCALIALFIIFNVWAERRRARLRKSRMQNKKAQQRMNAQNQSSGNRSTQNRNSGNAKTQNTNSRNNQSRKR